MIKIDQKLLFLLQKTRMEANKPKITVFITANRKFRAKIKVDRKPTYEVTIGGNEWKKGKGREFEHLIKSKCKLLIAQMEQNFYEIWV